MATTSSAAFCSYDKGMFAATEVNDPSVIDIGFDLEAACYHEAGHAVIGYLLGQGCASVSVATSYAFDSDGRPVEVGYGGMARGSRSANRRVNKDLASNRFTPALGRFGITISAGPAAERKFRIQSNMSLHLRSGTTGDHRQIDTVSRSLEYGGRTRYAFQRLVWRMAQRLIEVPRIWECITDLAEILFDGADLSGDADDVSVVSGSRARSVITRYECGPAHAEKWLLEARRITASTPAD